MNSECERIADQLRRAFAGDAWHGPPLQEILDGVTADQAIARPMPSVHNIWELVLHIDLYVRIALDATNGFPMARLFETGKDWPPAGRGETEWAAATDRLLAGADQLAQAVEQFGDSRLQDTAPGREYDFYYLFHGIIQHSLYHGGQIALVKKALPAV